ncbi:MAG: hypothetical protein ACR2P6_03895 [Gammaproteobacteria bacterium]
MKKLVIFATGILLNSIAFAGPTTFLEGGIILGGENGQNGDGDESGYEITGSYALDDGWYAGGALGKYDRDNDTTGDTENTYFNINGGRVLPLTDSTDLNFEGGFWFGDQDNPGGADSTDPKAIEIKAGLTSRLTDAFSLFGTIAGAAGDLDTDDNDDLRDFIWSLGAAYAFSENFSLNVKIVEGSNGVNGQDDVARIGLRWTFD